MKYFILGGFGLVALLVGAPVNSNASNTGNNSIDLHAYVNNATQDNSRIKQEIEAKKQQIQQRIKDKKEERKLKLSDSRLDTCKKREAAINIIIKKRVATYEKHLETFDKVFNNLTLFVARKNLQLDSSSTTKSAVDTKRAIAVESIDALKAQTFSCAVTNAESPGDIPKEVDKLARDALKDYRSAIREYAQSVKQAAHTSQLDKETSQ